MKQLGRILYFLRVVLFNPLTLLLAVMFGVIAVIGVGCSYYTSVVVEQTWYVPGDASRFDPVTAYEGVRTHAASDAELVSLEARYVRSDGTLDLYASYSPRVEYAFVRLLASPPADAPPVGAGGSVTGKWYEPIEVEVYRPGQTWNVQSGNSEYTYTNYGMDREPSSPVVRDPGFTVTPPTCSFAHLWDAAIESGADTAAVAIITYDQQGYTFTIRDLNFDLKFDFDCRIRSN